VLFAIIVIYVIHSEITSPNFEKGMVAGNEVDEKYYNYFRKLGD